jgi:hypothetical protein
MGISVVLDRDSPMALQSATLPYDDEEAYFEHEDATAEGADGQ